MGQKELLEKLYNQTLRFLSFRPRSENEIHNFLAQKLRKFYDKRLARAGKLSQNEFQDKLREVIARLKGQNLVNDEEFVSWWLEQRLEFNPRGKQVLAKELLVKGIARELVEEKLSTISNQQLRIAAQKILAKKLKIYSHLTIQELKSKLIQHLLVRGFEYDLSKKLVDEFLQKR